MQTNYKPSTFSVADALPPYTDTAAGAIVVPLLAGKLQQIKTPDLSKGENQTSLILYSDKKMQLSLQKSKLIKNSGVYLQHRQSLTLQ